MRGKETKSKRYEFFIEDNSIQYKCERIVTGSRVLRQTIYVCGVGSQDDSADYGPKHHPTESMAGVAKIIAGEIIQKSLRKCK